MPQAATTLMRLPQVKAMTGLSKSTIYNQIASGDFPRQIQLGYRTVAWVEADIQDWIQGKIKAGGS
jgi:prophage regulatory protein